MKIQAEVSIYPLRTVEADAVIDCFLGALAEFPVAIRRGAVSSRVTGEQGEVFGALAQGFGRVAERCQVVMALKVSNACPMEEDPDSAGAAEP